MEKPSFPEFDAQKAMQFPLGAASPLWFAFAGAAAAGAAYYWMARWRDFANLEAVLELPAQAAEAVEEAVEAVVEVAPEPVAEPEVVVEAAPEPEAVLEPQDLTRLVGIGPKLAASLAERGVTRFEHIAAWTTDDIAQVNDALKLMGRIDRDAWVAQAKRFAAEV
jgi:predicted flap endonuclease-1-like 5' DNA nuclease